MTKDVDKISRYNCNNSFILTYVTKLYNQSLELKLKSKVNTSFSEYYNAINHSIKFRKCFYFT